jgi:hypothetical protein
MSDVPAIRPELVAVALVLGVLAIAAATTIATRHEPAVRGRRMRSLGPLVPWIGSVLVVVLLVRGSSVAAVVLGVGVVLHALVTRTGGALLDGFRRRRPDRGPGGNGRPRPR